jgi:hypothetical protein
VLGQRLDLLGSSLWFLAILAGLLSSVFIKPLREVLATGPVYNEGFTVLQRPDLSECTKELNARRELVYWRNWTPDKGVVPGRWESEPFVMRKKVLIVPLVGYPAASGNRVYVECLQGKARIRLAYGNCHEKWSESRAILPSGWRGQPLRIVAECNSATNYLGIGPPLAASDIETDMTWAVLIFRHSLIILIFAAILRTLWALVPSSLAESSVERSIVAILLLAAIGYANFFVIHHLGIEYSLVPCCFLAMWGLVLLVRDHGLRLLNPVRLCVENPGWGGLVILSLMCVLALYLQRTISIGFIANYRFYPAQWSTDNQLPMDLAKALSTGGNIFELGWGQWLVSDRPPLLAGLMAIPFLPLSHWKLLGDLQPPSV